MTDLRQAAQQALEALTIYSDAQCSLKGQAAITALRTALEQQAEPVQEQKYEKRIEIILSYLNTNEIQISY